MAYYSLSKNDNLVCATTGSTVSQLPQEPPCRCSSPAQVAGAAITSELEAGHEDKENRKKFCTRYKNTICTIRVVQWLKLLLN
jgi:hypothetical protein